MAESLTATTATTTTTTTVKKQTMTLLLPLPMGMTSNQRHSTLHAEESGAATMGVQPRLPARQWDL